MSFGSSADNFNNDQTQMLLLTNKIVSSVSIASCVIILIIHWLVNEIRDFILTLVVWLCISNILYCSTAFYPYDNEREANLTWCGIQAFSILAFQYSGWMISCLLGYSLFITVIRKDHFEKNRMTYKIVFILLIAVISLGLASIILLTDTYGPTGGWCWVDVYRTSGDRALIRKLVLFYYITNWFFIILSTFFVFKVINLLSNAGKKSYTLLLIAHKLKYLPIIHIICILPSTISRMYNLLQIESNFTLALLQTIFGSINGLGYLIVYLLIPQVNQSLKILYARVFKKEEKNNDNGNSSLDLTNDFMEHWRHSREQKILKVDDSNLINLKRSLSPIIQSIQKNESNN